MRVLIVGAFGYLGMALCRRLAREHYVVATGRAPRVYGPIGCAWPMGGIAHQMDVFSLDADALRDIDAIVHLAGAGGAGGALPDPEKAHRDIIQSAAHIASIAPKGCRLLLASTIYIYGTGIRPFRETDTLAPDTLYGQCKAVAEALWQKRGGTALRFAHIYGAGSGIDFGRDGVTERLARAANGGPPFEIHGDGSQVLDLVHIDDACEAVALALKAPGLPPAVNIGGGAPVTVADLPGAFGVPCVRDLFDYGPPSPIRRALDISLAKTLGWAPKVTLTEGAKGLIEMMRSNPC